jgi:cytochrome c-type biogenesis protein CcmH
MIVAALSLIVLVLALLLPGWRKPDVLEDRYCLEVAHHQRALQRITADADVSGADEQAMRLDVQRRMLRLRRDHMAAGKGFGRWIMALPVTAFVAVLLGYHQLGHPDLIDRPLPRLAPQLLAAQNFDTAQARLLKNPADVTAWIDLSLALQRQGKTVRANDAMAMATQVMPGSADLWVARGQALLAHGGGQVSPAARLAFDRASALDPHHPGPRFYLALAWLQAGEPQQALPLLEGLARDSKADAAWMPRVMRMTRGAKAMIGAGIGTALPPR